MGSCIRRVQHGGKTPGVSMRHVDALSRNFVMSIEDSVLEQVRNAQATNDECKLIKQLIEKKGTTEYVERGGVVYHVKDGQYRLKIPTTMAHSLLQRIHGDGHLNKKRMELLVKQDYEIAESGKKIAKIIDNCIPCILTTKKRGKQDG